MPSLSLACSSTPQKIIPPKKKKKRKQTAFITRNLKNVYWIMNTSHSQLRCPPLKLAVVKVRLPLQRAWTTQNISGRARRWERGWQMCSIMWEEAAQRVRIQMFAPSDVFQPTGLIVFVWHISRSLLRRRLMQGSGGPAVSVICSFQGLC